VLHAVRPMMYGYGDSDQPLPETVDLVEVWRRQYNRRAAL
jgi:Transcription initiation factor IID, 18kD subunit